jgi:hypothetical protein
MTWAFNEIVRAGNSTARVKNYYPETGFIVLYDIYGEFDEGAVITGDDSGTSTTLTEFNVAFEFDIFYDPDPWEPVLPLIVTLDSGSYVALDEHFTGKASQEYQTENLVTIG